MYFLFVIKIFSDKVGLERLINYLRIRWHPLTRL